MSSQARQRWLEVEQLGDVTLVRIVPREILDEMMIQVLGEQLYALVDEERCRRLVLNFGAVRKMTSPMLGKIRKLYDKVQGVGGRLAFCKIHPALQPGFDILQLPRSLMHDEEQAALEAIQRGS
ncbi:MAG TPA: STAS domain-containing protein [Gemmataceae bacterium]|jgi:anti-anti-sigma regulatory factor|nr:STAS domain-containing protein [Gemmataceae bacterium]